jgi:catechol 2,3-dioxygenase-like lactoylglutathione lyase family enzyme
MTYVGLDHLVVNTRDVENAVKFYRDVLGMEILRLDEFREGKVGFVSARVSAETIIDIRPDPSVEKATPNVDHFCLVLGPTDMKELHSDLKAKGVQLEGDVHPAWGAQGYGEQFKIWDPEGNKIELRCYAATG